MFFKKSLKSVFFPIKKNYTKSYIKTDDKSKKPVIYYAQAIPTKVGLYVINFTEKYSVSYYHTHPFKHKLTLKEALNALHKWQMEKMEDRGYTEIPLKQPGTYYLKTARTEKISLAPFKDPKTFRKFNL